jgi:hypothetical protein
MFAHEEHLAGARRQHLQAALERGKKLLVVERLLGPRLRRLAPVAGLVEERFEVLDRGSCGGWCRRSCA